MKRILIRLVLAGLALFVVIQLVPYGRDHKNPPVAQAAVFRGAALNQIVTDSCADCHSNLTKWPWYTNVAPASWLVANDVSGGRENMNLSEWNKPQPPLDDIVEKIQSGEMPPLKYKLMPNHSRARLSSQQKQQLIAGFKRLYADQPPSSIRQGGGG